MLIEEFKVLEKFSETIPSYGARNMAIYILWWLIGNVSRLKNIKDKDIYSRVSALIEDLERLLPVFDLPEMYYKIKLIRTLLAKDCIWKYKTGRNIIRNCNRINYDDEAAARNLANNFNGEVQKPRNLRIIEGAVPVVLCTNEGYAPFLAVMLQSLLDNTNTQRKYHFIIFERSLSVKTKSCLKDQVSKYSNCEIDFVDIEPTLKEIPLAIPKGTNFTLDAYSRFLIPYWLSEYPKVIYCNGNMFAKADIAQLYDLDINGHCIAAAADQTVNWCLDNENYSFFIKANHIFQYIEDWSRYVNSGVLVFGTQKFNEKFCYRDFFKTAIFFTNRYKWHLCEQDVLNFSIKGDFFVLPTQWNHAWSLCHIPDKFYYQQPKSDVKIIHFTGELKPWKNDIRITDNPDAIAYRNYSKTVALYNETINKRS
jgi:lipopolysaccharide biosynthesis glycosyltransferase